MSPDSRHFATAVPGLGNAGSTRSCFCGRPPTGPHRLVTIVLALHQGGAAIVADAWLFSAGCSRCDRLPCSRAWDNSSGRSAGGRSPRRRTVNSRRAIRSRLVSRSRPSKALAWATRARIAVQHETRRADPRAGSVGDQVVDQLVGHQLAGSRRKDWRRRPVAVYLRMASRSRSPVPMCSRRLRLAQQLGLGAFAAARRAEKDQTHGWPRCD